MTQRQSQVNLNLLSIHQFAQVCRTTPRTLRFYEQKGLFKPAKVDQWNKYRLYDPKQARDFLKIRLLQNFHIPLSQINKSIAKDDAESYLRNELARIKEEIKEKEKEYKFPEKIKSFLFQNGRDSGRALPRLRSGSLARMTDSSSRHSGDEPSEDSRISNKGIIMVHDLFKNRTFGPFKLFCMKVEHGEYSKITEYIKTLWKEAKKLKLKCEPSEIAFYLNNAYNPKNTPLEIALILKSTSEESFGHLRGVTKARLAGRRINNGTMKQLNNEVFYLKTYPKTKTLAFKYVGPYEYLILVYQKLFSYIESRKIKIKGLVFETYKYGPLNTKSKYDYQTIIGFPI